MKFVFLVFVLALSICSGSESAMPFLKKNQIQNSLIQTGTESGRINIYDNALGILFFLRNSQTEQAANIVSALHLIQAEDGSLPFNVTVGESTTKSQNQKALVRSGAMAWVGLAVVRYLNHKKNLPNKEKALELVHGIARYLMTLQEGDLIKGGFGDIKYSVLNETVSEKFEPTEIKWISTEHNLDAYFFFKALGELTQDKKYKTTAKKISQALMSKLWNEKEGQFHQGLMDSKPNESLALDCASWGSIFLTSIGQKKKAKVALKNAEKNYQSRFESLQGHKPYFSEPLFAYELASFYKKDFPINSWKNVEGVWVEGTAGVSLAYLRTGNKKAAQKTLENLKPLMEKDLSFPDFTKKVPYTFENKPSTAGTLWYWLVEAEIKSPASDQLLWR